VRLRRRRRPSDESEVESEVEKPKKGKRRRRPRLAKDRQIEAIGIALVAFGFAATVLTWSGIRTATNVAYQLPVLASGGLTAIGCFVVGGLLLVGGMVMTRFARLEKARQALPDASEARQSEVRLAEQDAPSREAVPSTP
jgi:hypothetical protein